MQIPEENPHSAAGAAGVQWTPPATREEADSAIIALSNDIGLILAQLAEDQVAWCQRTGRAPADYGAWRRRALFAKVHKEGQLRECKRVRTQLSGAERDGIAAGAITDLLPLCRDAVEAWIESGAAAGATSLDAALQALAEYLERVPADTGRPATLALRGRFLAPASLEEPLSAAGR